MHSLIKLYTNKEHLKFMLYENNDDVRCDVNDKNI